jgi:hypothetical protein
MYNLIAPGASSVAFIAGSEHLNKEDVQFRSKLGPGEYQLQQGGKGYRYTIGRKLLQRNRQISGRLFKIKGCCIIKGDGGKRV